MSGVVHDRENNLAARWRNTTRQWLAARAEYRALCEAETKDVTALRKAAQRLYDLEQIRSVLRRELEEPPEE